MQWRHDEEEHAEGREGTGHLLEGCLLLLAQLHLALQVAHLSLQLSHLFSMHSQVKHKIATQACVLFLPADGATCAVL